MPMLNVNAIVDPVILRGDRAIAYRDPAAHYHDGVFRVFHTQMHREEDDRYFAYVGVTRSEDLVEWSEPEILTPHDQSLNYSSPGNVIHYGGEWLICWQTYPTPENQPTGDQTARVYISRSIDLEAWSTPELLRVKGPDVPDVEMGRMIDPFLVEDRDQPGKWWCFYKQNGASLSYTLDFETWTYSGHVGAGENVCVLLDREEYVLIHSPKNGIGVKRSTDLREWRDEGLLALGQANWPWAAGRLTAGQVLDLREDERVGKALMFFHGSTALGAAERETHGESSLGIAWSDDLVSWSWAGSGNF